MNYLKGEWVNFVLGMIALFLGTFGTFIVPLYIGFVINDLAADPPDYDAINKLCIELAVIILVNLNQFFLTLTDFFLLRHDERLYIQYHE